MIDVTDAEGADATPVDPGAGPTRTATRDDLPGYDDAAETIVLLTGAEPLVLLPDITFDPTARPWVPAGPAAHPTAPAAARTGRPDRPDDTLTLLVDRVFAPADDAARGLAEEPETDGIRDTLAAAADSPGVGMPRWILAGLVWLVAAALLVPLAVKALGTSIHVDLNLWNDQQTTQQQPADQPAR